MYLNKYNLVLDSQLVALVGRYDSITFVYHYFKQKKNGKRERTDQGEIKAVVFAND